MSWTFKLAGTDVSAHISVPGYDGVDPWQMTEEAEKGSAGSGRVIFDDPASAIDPLSHAPLLVTESGATPPMIAAGYVSDDTIARGVALNMANARQFDATITDLNILLTDRLIVTGGKRPAETDIARIDWLLASGYLPIGDAGFIQRTSPTSLPAADYTGRTPADVLADCSNESNKNYFVRWEEAATFPDGASPWAPALVSDYVPPGAGPGYVPSSLDALGGQYGGAAGGTYYPGAGYASTHALSVGGDAMYGSQQPVANNGSQFGFGTAGVYVAYPSDMTAEGRWVWDLTAAGLPTIATVGLYEWVRGVPGHPALADWSVEVSDNGTTWTTLFDQADITAAPVTLGASILDVAGGSARRYVSLHITVTVPGGGDWVGHALGILLWAGAAIGPGPVLCYHDPIWSGDECSVGLSDVPAEINNTTVFSVPPVAKFTRGASRIYGGCYYEYSGGHVYVVNATTAAMYFADGRFGRDARASDMNCKTAATATRLATAYLARCATPEMRSTGVILQRMTGAQVNLTRPGQAIAVHLTHVPDFSSGGWMQIAKRTVTPFSHVLYDVELELVVPILTGFKGGGFGASDLIRPAPWVRNTGQLIAPAPSDPTLALPGQRVAMTYIRDGDGVATLVTLGSAYIPGSLRAQVDGQEVTQAAITETDPDAGIFALDFAPAAASSSAPAQALAVSWQVAP